MDSRMRVAIVGCGNIAARYAQNLATYPQIELLGYTDLDLNRAEMLAELHGGRVYPTLEALLADPAVELVVNLTIHHAHYRVNKAVLEAGKHLMSEKPLALSYAEAAELLRLAEARGLRIGATPFSFLGEAQQTALKLVRDGRLGRVRVAYAEVNWGRLETWHPNPAPFYDVGPLVDVGVYPLTLLSALFGPARQVQAYGRVVHPERATSAGVPFTVTTPDFAVIMVEFAGGVLARLTTNFYVLNKASQQGIELHGDQGSLRLNSWLEPDASVAFAPFGEPYTEVPPLRQPPPAIPWGMNVAELADAIHGRRRHRTTGEHAAHVVEIMEAAATSLASHRPIAIESGFAPPELMEWAR